MFECQNIVNVVITKNEDNNVAGNKKLPHRLLSKIAI